MEFASEAESNREILFVGGRIYGHPQETGSDALLVRDGRVAAIGEDAEVRSLATRGAQVVSLEGAVVTAGFVDAHIHPTAWAISRGRVALAECRTVEEAADRVMKAAGAGEGWLLGHGWSVDTFGRWPTRADLDRLIPDRPVFLDSRDLHSAWLNSAAIRALGLDASMDDPPGGRIERDPHTGSPTGLLFEAARAAAVSRLPAPSQQEVRSALLDAQTALHALGLTGIHSFEATGLADFERLEEVGELTLRVLQHIQLDQLDAALEVGLRSGFGGDRLRIGGVKIFLDGALGSRTAWMRQPYEREEAYRGIRAIDPDRFREAVARAADGGIATTVHAIGDAAVDLALDTLGSIPAPATLPHRIEHLQLCPPDLWRRAGQSGIVASMQPVHLLGDIPAVDRHWGADRAIGAYPFAGLRREGMLLAFGSDAPVETPDPRAGLLAATRRIARRADGTIDHDVEGWYPEHRLTGAEAVVGYTVGPAMAEGMTGRRRGTLRPGNDADLVVWSDDPIDTRPHEYLAMECLLTMVGGEIVWRRNQ